MDTIFINANLILFSEETTTTVKADPNKPFTHTSGDRKLMAFGRIIPRR